MHMRLGRVQTTDKKCWTGKVPMVIRSHDAISPFSVFGAKGLLPGHDSAERVIKSVIPRACSRRWPAFIAIFIYHGEPANGIFLHCVYRCTKTQA